MELQVCYILLGITQIRLGSGAFTLALLVGRATTPAVLLGLPLLVFPYLFFLLSELDSVLSLSWA
jgi:hypothetical protein